jgi:hypothetical protein
MVVIQNSEFGLLTKRKRIPKVIETQRRRGG